MLLGDNGRDVKLADAGLSAFMHHDYMAAKSNIGPFIYTVGSCSVVSAFGSSRSDRASRSGRDDNALSQHQARQAA